MKIYFYDNPDCHVSDAALWHRGGAVVICTDRDPQVAWDVYLLSHFSVEGVERQWPEGTLLGQPSRVVATPHDEEFVDVFPDAGCC